MSLLYQFKFVSINLIYMLILSGPPFDSCCPKLQIFRWLSKLPPFLVCIASVVAHEIFARCKKENRSKRKTNFQIEKNGYHGSRFSLFVRFLELFLLEWRNERKKKRISNKPPISKQIFFSYTFSNKLKYERKREWEAFILNENTCI